MQRDNDPPFPQSKVQTLHKLQNSSFCLSQKKKLKFLFLEETGKFEAKFPVPQTIKATMKNPFEKGNLEEEHKG